MTESLDSVVLFAYAVIAAATATCELCLFIGGSSHSTREDHKCSLSATWVLLNAQYIKIFISALIQSNEI